MDEGLIVAGVSTRGYRRTLEPVYESLETRGESKSHVSRALIERTTEELARFLERRLDDIEIVARFIDGIEIAKHSVIVALGIVGHRGRRIRMRWGKDRDRKWRPVALAPLFEVGDRREVVRRGAVWETCCVCWPPPPEGQ